MWLCMWLCMCMCERCSRWNESLFGGGKVDAEAEAERDEMRWRMHGAWCRGERGMLIQIRHHDAFCVCKLQSDSLSSPLYQRSWLDGGSASEVPTRNQLVSRFVSSLSLSLGRRRASPSRNASSSWHPSRGLSAVHQSGAE